MSSSTVPQEAQAARQQGKSGTQTAGEPPSAGRDPLDDLNRIRDILFGAQSREHTQRATRLEETIARVGAELSREMDVRFQALQTALAKHVEELGAKLAREQAARLQASAELQQELTELGKTLQAGTALLGEHTKQEQADLRQRLAEQQDSLLREMVQRHDELSKTMERALAELRSEKVTRAALAELFVKSAQSLAGQSVPTNGQ